MKNLPKKQLISIVAIVVIGIVLGILIMTMDKSKSASDGHGHGEAAHTEEASGDKHGHGHAEKKGGHDDHGHDEEQQAKGPHGGRMFTEEDFGIEVVMAEEGGEARLRAYLYEKGKPLAPNSAQVTTTLVRPDGQKQELAFTPEKDYLKSNATVAEPHIFEATVAVQTSKEPHLFIYAESEGVISLNEEQQKAAGVTIHTAGPAKINSSLTLSGEIRYNEDRTAHVVPRLVGSVQSVPVALGQQVKKGQVLAVIASSSLSEQRSELSSAQQRLALAKTTFEREKKLWEEKVSAEQDYLQARQALQEADIAVRNARQKLSAVGATATGGGALGNYELRSPLDGMVMEKHISIGETLKEDANIFTISDLSTVWAEVAVPAKDLNVVRVGATVTVRATAFEASAQGTISYVGALLGEQTRTAKARVSLPNRDMTWRPGLFVNVDVVSNQAEVPVTVTTDAIQSVNDKPTVFVSVPGGFVPQQVTLGRSDGKVVEVVKGLKAGSKYVGAGSFVVKSEQGKASAEHVH